MTSTRSEGLNTIVEMIEIESITGDDIERLMKADINMRDVIASKEKEIKKIKEERSQVQAILLEACKHLKSDSLKNKVGTLTRRVKKRYWTTDWPSMFKFIKEKVCFYRFKRTNFLSLKLLQKDSNKNKKTKKVLKYYPKWISKNYLNILDAKNH